MKLDTIVLKLNTHRLTEPHSLFAVAHFKTHFKRIRQQMLDRL